MVICTYVERRLMEGYGTPFAVARMAFGSHLVILKAKPVIGEPLHGYPVPVTDQWRHKPTKAQYYLEGSLTDCGGIFNYIWRPAPKKYDLVLLPFN
jgi:hypothetical protein